jgi:hypothetical protein
MLVAPPGTVQRLLSALAAARWTAQKWQQGGRRGVAVTAHLTLRPAATPQRILIAPRPLTGGMGCGITVAPSSRGAAGC